MTCFIYGLPVTKVRDTIEPVIKPQAYLVRNATPTASEMFLSSTNLFLYEQEEGGTPITESDYRIIKTRSDQQRDATLAVTVANDGTIDSVDVIDGGQGYDVNVSCKISMPPDPNGRRATVTVITDLDDTGRDNSYKIDDVSVSNPGAGYTTSVPAFALPKSPDIQYEDIVSVPVVQGFAGIVTGIQYLDSNDNPDGVPAVNFFYRVPATNAPDLTQLQPGYPVVVSNTVVGPGGVTPVRFPSNEPVSIGGSFLDAIYEVRSTPPPGSFVGSFRCTLEDQFTDPNLPSGVVFEGENLGQFSWGRLANMTREGLNFDDIVKNGEATQYTPDLRNFPEITRTNNGLRDQGGLNKFIAAPPP